MCVDDEREGWGGEGKARQEAAREGTRGYGGGGG